MSATGAGPGRRVAEVVAADLCIGCGLCEAVTGGRVTMVETATGSLRPSPTNGFTEAEEAAVLAACPGVVAPVRPEPTLTVDPVWGAHRSMRLAWAADDDVRFEAATGGVLTALAGHLLDQGEIAFVLHVGPDPDRPARSRWVLSETAEEVRANSGSWYGPTAPLAGLGRALDRNEPFALVAKPCDLGALHAYAAVDARVDRLCVARLTMVCGGQSRFTKTATVLGRFGVDEGAVTSLRYRGHGNPGPTRVETVDGHTHQLSYQEMWADESSWDVETRCKVCPDALGECADVAAADAWPGGAPTGEDEGFNAIVIRTGFGQQLVDSATDDGDLVLGTPINPRRFDALQPHQVRKKIALAARLEGLAAAGIPPIEAADLRLTELGRRLTPEQWEAEHEGARRRASAPRP